MSADSPAPSVVVLVADGARPDVLRSAIEGGDLPAMAALVREGGLHEVTSSFPSVTGPAYAPFLMGRFPGPVGLPGLRWFDRARTACHFPDYTRSYVGYQMGAVDRDLDPDAPTIFELVPESIAALNVIGRGLPARARVAELSLRSAVRAARTHFRGDVRGWLGIDREVSAAVAARLRSERPRFAFAALTGADKTAHSEGHAAPVVREALRIVDDAVAEIRGDAEHDGRWDRMQLWIVSDHGHSPVRHHEDLAALVAAAGHRTIAHPWVFALRPDAAVMVSGNAMAHVYVELARRERPWWRELDPRWHELADLLLARPSVDLLLLPHGTGRCEVRARGRGSAFVERRGGATIVDSRYRYRTATGDPLGLGGDVEGDATEMLDATLATDYPDSIVQIAHLAGSPRSGELILSAARDWDFRARYEPIPHVSSHGALHREHMLVPLLTNRPPSTPPRRTVDVMPSALAALGLPIPPGLDGRSFL
ncbi:MAG TPA: alkaline phosphatase family protein [Gemmatimonadaceae bacterium]|nr:alkaline phosphatase family protein [Gemmatimonadaceae bacterium]